MANELSFAKVVKEEITTHEFSKDVNISLLSSFLKLTGSLVIDSTSEKIVIRSENSKVIRYIFQIIKYTFDDIELSFSYRKNMRFNKSYEFIINILSKIDEVIDTLKLDLISDEIDHELVAKDERVRGYMIGLFLAKGSISDPRTSNYHFEVYSSSEEYSKNILRLTKRIKVYPFDFKFVKRRNNYVIYLKKAEQIASILAYMDANESSLIYEDYRLERDLKNYTNRQSNLDYYNYRKSMQKSDELVKLINYIDEKLGIKNIYNNKVKELCFLKLEHPEASYSELSVLLSDKLGKPVSKSNVNHLIRRIKEIGEKLNYEKNRDNA